jgi:hypothetical protein
MCKHKKNMPFKKRGCDLLGLGRFINAFKRAKTRLYLKPGMKTNKLLLMTMYKG